MEEIYTIHAFGKLHLHQQSGKYHSLTVTRITCFQHLDCPVSMLTFGVWRLMDNSGVDERDVISRSLSFSPLPIFIPVLLAGQAQCQFEGKVVKMQGTKATKSLFSSREHNIFYIISSLLYFTRCQVVAGLCVDKIQGQTNKGDL